MIYHHRTKSLPSFRTISITLALVAYLQRAEETDRDGEARVGVSEEKEKEKRKVEEVKEEEVGSHASRLALFYRSEVFP